MSKYIVAIDQGTTSTRAILFNRKFHEVKVARRALKQSYPKKGWVEHDPNEIFEDVLEVCREVIGTIDPSDISGFVITNQRETTILWDKSNGNAIYPAIVWQDRRTQGYCLTLADDKLNLLLQEKTGLLLDPYFSATKINWILNNVGQARIKAENGDVLFGTIDSFLIWKLTKGMSHVTDITNASRTMVYNIREQCWDEELLNIFKIPKDILPKVQDNDGYFGKIDSSYFGKEIPILSVIGDQQSATIGQSCLQKNAIKCTLGTGCFLVINTGSEIVTSQHKLLTTVCYKLNGDISYALEGSIFMAGSVIQWMRDKLGLFDSAAKTQQLAESVSDNNGVYMVPAFTGFGAPHWIPQAKASILGMTIDTTKAHIVRAGLEAVAYQLHDIVQCMLLDYKGEINSLKIDGGMASNHWLLQFIADIVGYKVDKAQNTEATAVGAAYIGAVISGWESSITTAARHRQSETMFSRHMEQSQREMLLKEWRCAVDTTIFHSKGMMVEL